MDNIAKLTALGQSLWLDNIQRQLLEDGEINELIQRGDIRGMTSNPTIFEHAIAHTGDYNESLTSLAWAGADSQKIFWELAIEDIRAAADLFAPLYEQTAGGDGYVSVEVSPLLADDTEGTVAQAQQIWARVARPNVMVKIPATAAGLPAIRRSIAAGLNINITLIFARNRYAAVMDAFMSGLEDRLAAGRPIDRIASVASFFVSRVDTKIDQRLPADSSWRGKAGIANAKLAYDDFLKMFSGPRWSRLEAHGARKQRPLWASTSTKNSAYPDTLYVDGLIGPDTVNTLPPKTLAAARDHSMAQVSITTDLEDARATIAALERSGIGMDQVTAELEIEGVKAFSDSIADVLRAIEERRTVAVQSLGPLYQAVSRRIEDLESSSVPARLWAHDPTLWTTDPAGQAEVERRMGWTDAPQKAQRALKAYADFANTLRGLHTGRFLVLGMGGSSLAAEVFSSLFTSAFAEAPSEAGDHGDVVCLGVLDSTHPAEVAKAAVDYPADSSLYVVASKSGGTSEVTAGFDFFWARSHGDGGRFVATTDPHTSLEELARKLGFRKIFLADPMVGGRYSALTDFGLVPAALLGIDISRLLDRAVWMQRQCSAAMPAAASPGMTLGAVLAEAALAGRDKLTIVADPAVGALANWIEQLVAESSGKLGKGIIPVALEPMDVPAAYREDRIFVYLRQNGIMDTAVQALGAAGFPVLTFGLHDAYDVGAEFFRWETAVAVACHILGVNAFDQPDVQESKDRTKAKLDEFRSSGALVEGKWDLETRGDVLDEVQRRKLMDFLRQAGPGDYFALNAYLPRNQEMIDALQRMRVAIRERTRAAVTAGFGPRFQHSTGQLHKGGPNTGLFLQITSEVAEDIQIPTEAMTFGAFVRAQALGDYETLMARRRRVFRAHLRTADDIRILVKALQ